MGPSPRAHPVAGRFLTALQHRDYRMLWLSSLFAGSASWALIVARGWVVLEQSQSSLMVGIATFAAMAPRVVVAPFAGLLADRMDRRTVLAVAHGVNLAQVLALAVLALTNTVTVTHLLVLSLINGVAQSVQVTTSGALLPNLVPPGKLLNAVALQSATLHSSRLLGPLLILPLMATVNAGWSFALCAGLYAMTLALLMRIRTSSTGVVQPDRGVVSNLLAGLVYTYRDPFLLSLVLLATVHCALTMAFESLLPTISAQRLNTGGAGVSALMMGVGAGAFLTTMGIAGMQSNVAKGRLFMALGLFSGISPLGLALASAMPWAWLATVAMGASQAGFMAITTTIVQSLVPDAIRGRMSAVLLWHTGGVMAVVNLVNGGLADVVPGGASILLTVTGIAFIGVMALSLLRAPLRWLYVRGTPLVERGVAV